MVQRGDYGEECPLNFLVEDMNNGRGWYKKFHRHPIRITKDFNDCEDIAGEFLLNLTKNNHRKIENDKMIKWLYACLNREEINFLRATSMRKKHIVYFSERPYETDIEDEATKTPEEILLDNEIKQTLGRCISGLNKKHQQVIKLHYWEGIKRSAIAHQLNISVKNVDDILWYTNIKLRRSKKLSSLVS